MADAKTVAELVGRIPDLDKDGKFTGPEPRDARRIFDVILEGGEEDLGHLIDMIAELDDGKDYRARYVLHGIVGYVCEAGRDAQQDLVRRTFAKQLGSGRTKPVKGFLLRELQVCGGADEMGAIGALVTDSELSVDATNAGLAIREGAAEQFRAALAKASGGPRLNVLQALGVLQDKASVPVFLAAARDADRDVRLTALWGVANTGDVRGVDALIAAAGSEGYERTQVTKCCLLLGEKLVAAGDKASAARIYRHLMTTRTTESEQYVREAVQRAFLAAGLADPTGPTAPTSLKAEPLGHDTMKLTWGASKDDDTGILAYTVSRDGAAIASVKPSASDQLEFVDRGLTEDTEYAYSVTALNLGKVASASSETRGRTAFDTEAPRLAGVKCLVRSPDQVELSFTKPLARARAESAGSYAISPNGRVESATLSRDGTKVLLKVVPLREGSEFKLTVTGLTDSCKKANAVANPSATFAVTRQEPGVWCACYEGILGDDLEAYKKATPKHQGVVPKIDASAAKQNENYSLRFEGLVAVPANGEYTFYTSSDDGSRLYINGELVVRNDGMHGTEEQSGKVELLAGTHAITVTFYQGGGGAVVKAEWYGPGLRKDEIPAEALFHLPGVYSDR